MKRDKLYKSTSVWNSNVGSGKEMDDATTTTITLVYSKIGTEICDKSEIFRKSVLVHVKICIS